MVNRYRHSPLLLRVIESSRTLRLVFVNERPSGIYARLHKTFIRNQKMLLQSCIWVSWANIGFWGLECKTSRWIA